MQQRSSLAESPNRSPTKFIWNLARTRTGGLALIKCGSLLDENLIKIFQLSSSNTIQDLKDYIAREKLKFADINRQELRLEPKGKALKDDSTLKELGIQNGAMLYFKDRGYQIGWTTVFLTEYAGPLLVYLWIHSRPWIFYGDEGSADDNYKPVVK